MKRTIEDFVQKMEHTVLLHMGKWIRDRLSLTLENNRYWSQVVRIRMYLGMEIRWENIWVKMRIEFDDIYFMM
jgi:hypothetical protein